MKLLKKILILNLLLIIVMPYIKLSAKDIQSNSTDEKNIFANQALLSSVFEKLYNLERKKQGKINIVHIGDSHVQGDFFTNTIRKALQIKFGNGGFGFTFPYSLVATNGPRQVKYTSNVSWQSLRNIYPVADVGMGLSGIALYTSADNFMLQLSTTQGYEFNNVKIIYPTKEPQYKMSLMPTSLKASPSKSASSSTTDGIIRHKVRSGENLTMIARKHKVTVTQIKKANKLTSDNINAGRTLKIPVKIKTEAPKPVKQEISEDNNIEYVNMVSKPYYSSFTSDSLLNQIIILPAQKRAMYNLNGFVIENNKPGVIYHAIGVNGARITDYSKYPLFFEQLPILNPDLIILSFGTNESFGRMSQSEYLFKLTEFVKKIRRINKDAAILIMTPPPSMFKKRPNQYIYNRLQHSTYGAHKPACMGFVYTYGRSIGNWS